MRIRGTMQTIFNSNHSTPQSTNPPGGNADGFTVSRFCMEEAAGC